MAQPVTAVLGLGREVGQSVALRFHDAGHRVIIVDPSAKTLEQVRDGLPEDVVCTHGQLHTELGLRNALAGAVEAFGRVDHAVAIPRIPAPEGLSEYGAEEFAETIARSTLGAALTMRLFSERMKEQDELPASGLDRARQRGSVTFILSMRARQADPGRFTESVAQGAVLAAMRAGAIELAADRIRANAIVAVRPRADEDDSWLRQRTPWGRAALADEIADAAVYLSSPAAAIITGESLTLDGGRTALGGVID